MIITWLSGGLGNQMFQYAAGLALAERHRTTLKLDVSWFRAHPEYEAHNRYALSCFNVTEQFATQEEIDRVRGLGRRIAQDRARGCSTPPTGQAQAQHASPASSASIFCVSPFTARAFRIN